MQEIEYAILAFIRSVYDLIGWPGVAVLMAIESANIPLPSEIIMPLSGWMLIRDKGLDMTYTVVAGLYGAVGCTAGSVLSYWLGSCGGRPLIERCGKYVLISHHDLEVADRWFAKYGDAAIFLSRLLPVVRTFISFPAGVARMSLLKFTVYTFVGSFPWCLALAFAGYQLGEHWEQIRVVMRPFDIPIIIGVLVLFAVYIRRHLKRSMPSHPARRGHEIDAG
ncbi:MAG: DedA family protein [Chloroflexi bacterium]|nr:DedA family protein [Chloroflexota bacterium]